MQAAGYAALAQSGKILAVYARAGLGMQRLWAWLVEPKNQKALALLGSALVVCVGAGWAVFQEFFGVTPPSSMRVVENACGVGGGGRDVVISGISCNFGITLSEYERALARQEEMLRAELEAADKDSERQPLLEQNLEDVRERLGNIEAAFGERSVAFIDLARSLDGTPQKSAFTESFEQAVRTGDTSELEHKLRTDLDLGVRGAAARAYQLGLLLQQNGQVAEAYELFRRATILAPGQAEFEEALYRLADRLDVLLGNGRLRVSAVLTAGSEPTQARHFVFEPEADLDGNRKRIDYGDGIAVCLNFQQAPIGSSRVRTMLKVAARYRSPRPMSTMLLSS